MEIDVLKKNKEAPKQFLGFMGTEGANTGHKNLPG